MINDLHIIYNETNSEFELIFSPRSPRRADEPAAFLPALSAECQASGGRRDEAAFPPYALRSSNRYGVTKSVCRPFPTLAG